jgi:hypothetical protein
VSHDHGQGVDTVTQMDWLADLFRRFRGDLAWLATIWVFTALVVAGLTWLGRGESEAVALLVGIALLAIALTPIMWLRYERPFGWAEFRRALVAIGLAFGWTVLVLIGGLAVIRALGFD